MIPSHTTASQATPDSRGNLAADGRGTSPQARYSRAENLLPLSVLACGFIARLIQAQHYFLNPDEALHNMLANQASLRVAYRAALTNAHPPLLILVLHYWRWLGHSELWLRMPSVLAGTACCWIAYQWLKLVTDRSVAVIGLIILAFAPALIGLSAEIRQYAMLLFFMASCLYLGEWAVQQNSLGAMIPFSLSLYGALLTHYSSLLFAFTMGVYMLVRLWPYGKRQGLFAVWACGQVGALAVITYFLVTHVAHLEESGMARGIADTWLRKSIFHPGVDHAMVFVAAQTLRVFTYLFSHGVVGTAGLLAFLAGMVLLLKGQAPRAPEGPTPRQLGLLFGLPFLANCGAALAGIYPYGATRHNAFLAIFAVGGVGMGLAAWRPRRTWGKPLAVVAALALCNLFPAPPPLIKARNHSRRLMEEAVQSLRQSAPPGSIVFADYQSGLLLGYYACGHDVAQVFPPYQSLAKAECGPYTVVTPRPEEWKFYADDLNSRLANLAKTYALAPGTRIWLFDAGWITDSTPKLRKELQQFGCSAPRSFGENILLCQLTVGGSAEKLTAVQIHARSPSASLRAGSPSA